MVPYAVKNKWQLYSKYVCGCMGQMGRSAENEIFEKNYKWYFWKKQRFSKTTENEIFEKTENEIFFYKIFLHSPLFCQHEWIQPLNKRNICVHLEIPCIFNFFLN